MAVHQKRNGAWFVQWREDGKLRHKYFGKGALAKSQAQQFFDELGLRTWGRNRRTAGPTFAEVVQAYLVSRQHDLAESTKAGMIPKVKAIYLPELGHLDARSLTERRMEAYIAKRAKAVKMITIRREMEDIRAILNWAVKKRIILDNPMAGVTMPRNDGERIRPPSADEIKAILAAAPPHLKRVILISWYIGLRVGEELLMRRRQDVDFENQLFFVVSARKGGLDTRHVPIHPELYAHLLQWYIEDGEDPERHIITWKGKPVEKIKRAWATAKKKAGITRRLRPYDIRHAYCSDLLGQGVSPKTVGQIVGHKDEKTTMYVYNHVTSEDHWRAVKKRKSLFK